MRTRSQQQWSNVYAVLVKEAKAPESMLQAFVDHCTDGRLTEWRFGGLLGMGGKIWQDHNGKLSVDCYSENLDEANRRLISRINEQLKTM